MLFTIEFFRLREEDDAHATLDRITHIGTDLEAVKVKAKSLFETLNMPRVNTLANDDLRDAAHDRGELAGARRLQIWRAAYAAAYREMLAINHQTPRPSRTLLTPGSAHVRQCGSP